LRRALGKAHPRVAAVDDGPFRRADRLAPIAAVVVALPEQLESAGSAAATVDGSDGTAKVVQLLRRVVPSEGVAAILVDGAVVAGFNVLDLDAVRAAMGLPVVAVTRRPPEFARIRAALERWFPRTAARRFALLRRHRLFPVPTGGAPIWAAASGCSRADAVRLVQRTGVHGYWPEPLRIAHLVARAAAGYRGRTTANSKGSKRPRRRRGPVA
jgi:endonuclease V-like protein UPF0215 family